MKYLRYHQNLIGLFITTYVWKKHVVVHWRILIKINLTDLHVAPKFCKNDEFIKTIHLMKSLKIRLTSRLHDDIVAHNRILKSTISDWLISTIQLFANKTSCLLRKALANVFLKRNVKRTHTLRRIANICINTSTVQMVYGKRNVAIWCFVVENVTSLIGDKIANFLFGLVALGRTSSEYYILILESMLSNPWFITKYLPRSVDTFCHQFVFCFVCSL